MRAATVYVDSTESCMKESGDIILSGVCDDFLLNLGSVFVTLKIKSKPLNESCYIICHFILLVLVMYLNSDNEIYEIKCSNLLFYRLKYLEKSARSSMVRSKHIGRRRLFSNQSVSFPSPSKSNV